MHLGTVCSLGDESDLELERKYKEDDREKTPRRPRTQRTEKVQKIPSGKEAGQVSGVKKPIISVVLTAHEAIPGDHSKQEGAKKASFTESVLGSLTVWTLWSGQLAYRSGPALATHLCDTMAGPFLQAGCGQHLRWGEGRGPAAAIGLIGTFLSSAPLAQPESPGCPPLTTLGGGVPVGGRSALTRRMPLVPRATLSYGPSAHLSSAHHIFYNIGDFSLPFLSHKIEWRYYTTFLKKRSFRKGYFGQKAVYDSGLQSNRMVFSLSTWCDSCQIIFKIKCRISRF